MIPVSSIEYVNVRVRAQHSRLFTKETYDELIAGNSLGAVSTFLLDDPEYHQDVEIALEHKSEREGLEKGVSDHFIRSVNHIYQMVDGPMKKFFTLGLLSFELKNLRAIVIAHSRNLSYHYIEHLLIPCGATMSGDLRKAYENPDMKEMAKHLPSCFMFGDLALKRALRDTNKGEPLVNLINRLEQNLYKFILMTLDNDDDDAAVLKDIYRFEIDLKNIVAALKHVWRAPQLRSDIETIISGGYINKQFIRELAKAANLDEALIMIEKTRYHEAVEKGIIYFAETGYLHEMEHFFEQVFIEKTQEYKRIDPFGIGPFIAYVWAQFAEMINLRTIINGIAFKAGAGQIRKGLVNV